MASGWAADGAENAQIEDTINDAIARARRALPVGKSLAHCDDCGAPIPKARQQAMAGVRYCIQCQQSLEKKSQYTALYNRRGSKYSQLR